MSGYVIANIDVKNPEAYKEYVGKVVPTVQKFGGEYLVRAGDYKVISHTAIAWRCPSAEISAAFCMSSISALLLISRSSCSR